MSERAIYFFATDAQERLVGVLPTRRLLTAPLETRLEEIMVRRVVLSLGADSRSLAMACLSLPLPVAARHGRR